MKSLKHFFNNETTGAVILIIATVTAMVLANMKLTRNLYFSFLETSINLKIGPIGICKNILSWINDMLMTIFFLLIGLKVKKELIKGSLASRQQAVFPIIAAGGGMILPVLIYLAFNFCDPIARSGWGIPAVTDVAFSLGVLALLGNHVPISLKIFLMALAIVDDLGSIAIITFFYTNELSILSLKVVVVTILILSILNFYNVKNLSIYIVVGMVLWIAILKSGIHTTLAGIIVGFALPLKEEKEESPAQVLSNLLDNWVVFLILPLFAFANAGISLEKITSSITNTITLGIIAGLFIGKPLGISLFCWLVLKLNLACLPHGTTYKQIVAIGILCGVGFTMSIFISTLAFGAGTLEFIVQAKFGILIGSLLSAVLGFSLLKMQFLSSERRTLVRM